MQKADDGHSFNALSLKVLLWVEALISLRILFLSTPLILTRVGDHTYSVLNINDWFLILLTSVCLLHFVIGIASLGEHSFWRVFHYSGAFLVVVLTFGFGHLMHYLKLSFNYFYCVPAFLSVMAALMAFILKDKIQSV